MCKNFISLNYLCFWIITILICNKKKQYLFDSMVLVYQDLIKNWKLYLLYPFDLEIQTSKAIINFLE